MRNVVEHRRPVLARNPYCRDKHHPIFSRPIHLNHTVRFYLRHELDILTVFPVYLDAFACCNEPYDIISWNWLAAFRVIVHEVVLGSIEDNPARGSTCSRYESVEESIDLAFLRDNRLWMLLPFLDQANDFVGVESP